MVTAEVKKPGEPGFDQTEFNLARWAELLEDPFLNRLDQRIETDRFGRIIMSPIPAQQHGGYQFRIGHLLQSLLPEGRVITECPISTSEGVRGCDVAWISVERHEPQRRLACLTRAPEICVEVISPSNSKAELEEKQQLYFEAGADEVWLCDRDGQMCFFLADSATSSPASRLCPDFPRLVTFG